MDDMTRPKKLKVGILTVSDRAFRGEYPDRGGPAIADWLAQALMSPFETLRQVAPDEQSKIEQALIEFVEQGCRLILTTGGTGPSKRDVTPEATLAVMDKELPGFGERMRQISLQYVPTAILSRQVAVIRQDSLIINLPGQPKSIGETLGELFAAVPYCLELMDGPLVRTEGKIVSAFRPKSAPTLEELEKESR